MFDHLKIHPKVQEYLERVVIRNGEKWIYDDVDLFKCKELTELNFHDININGYFSISKTNVKSLIGSPKRVLGDFYFYGTDISSLEGITQHIEGTIEACDTNLNNLKGLGEFGKIHINNNNPQLKNCDYYIQYILEGKLENIYPDNYKHI